MNLRMTVMTTGNTVISPGGNNLVKFHLTISPALFGISGLEESAATAAAVIIGFIRCHFNDVFLTDHRFDNIPQIIGNWVTEAFSDNLAWILDCECDFKILVPIGINLESPFTNPFCIVLVN